MSDHRGLLDGNMAAGDDREIQAPWSDDELARRIGAAPRLILRPLRTEDDHEAMIAVRLARLSRARRGLASFSVDSGAGNGKARRRAALASGALRTSDERLRALVEAALDVTSYHELWWGLHHLEECAVGTPSTAVAREVLDRAQKRERVAWRRLRGFADGVAGLAQLGRTKRELDRVELGLLYDVVWRRDGVRVALEQLEAVERDGEGTQIETARQRHAARHLRAVLEPRGFTWKMLAELVAGSRTMSPQPCPQLVASYADAVDSLSEWLRKLVQDRSTRGTSRRSRVAELSKRRPRN